MTTVSIPDADNKAASIHGVCPTYAGGCPNTADAPSVSARTTDASGDTSNGSRTSTPFRSASKLGSRAICF